MDELAALVEQVPDEVLDYIEALEDRVEKAEAAAVTTEEPEVDLIAKALEELPEEIANALKDQKDRLEKAEKALEEERVAKADSEWVAKVRSIDGLIDNPETFGAELRQMAEANPELAESVLAQLQAANARLEKADIFAEMGHRASAPGSPTGKIETIAKSMVEADPTKSIAEATAEAWESNPALYEEYVAEQRALKS